MSRWTRAQIVVLFNSVEPTLARCARHAASNWQRITYEDFYSVGKVELMALAEVYDPALGEFGAYVHRAISGAMHDHAHARHNEDKAIQAIRTVWLREDAIEREDRPARLAVSLTEEMDETPEESRARMVREQHLKFQRLAAAYLGGLEGPIDPEELFLEEEESRAAVATINKVLDDFSAQERAAFKLHRLEGMTHQEVADRLGIAKITVRRAVQRVEDALKRAVVEAGIERPDLVARAWFARTAEEDDDG